MQKQNLGRLFIYFGILALAGLLFACNPPKKTSTPRPTRPGRPQEPTKPSAPIDTIKWKTNDPKKQPPITDGTGGTKPNKPRPGETYKIGVLLPFLTANYAPETGAVPEKSDLALQFYSGMKIAANELSSEINANLQLDLIDSDLTDDAFRAALAKNSVDKYDLIIGPMRSSQLQILALRTQPSRKVIISPQSVQPDLVKNYPQMVQISASLQTHCLTIGKYVKARYKPEQIVIVCREKEKERIAYFEAVPGWPKDKVKTLVLPDNAASITQSLKTYLSPTQTTAFILPSFGSQDFVNGFLRKLKTDKGKNQIAVFGLPQWEDFEQIEYESFAENNVHITRDYHLATESDAYQKFQKAFFEANGTVPNEQALKGYDVMRWVGTGLAKSGLAFAQAGNTPGKGLGYQFDLKPVTGADGTVNYTENHGVYILKFEDYRLIPVTGQ